MQSNERVCVQPVTARGMPAVDQCDFYMLILLDQGVGEGEATCSCSDNQIVGVDKFASSFVKLPCEPTLLVLSCRTVFL